jgi:hypothetical protein
MALLVSCEDASYRSIGADIRLLSRDVSGSEEAAINRLSGFGRGAIPQIEIALHTGPERGRLRLVGALERIGDGEAVPILRHFAVYDASPEVRAACERVLQGWGKAPDARGQQALQALRRVAEKRTGGEGPLAEPAGRP